MKIITTEEGMDELDMFQYRLGKIDESIWWGLERISADAVTQLTSTNFQDECQNHGAHFTLATPEHQ